MDATPVSLAKALGSFAETWSPRVVTTVNDYAVKIAHARGEHAWHVHDGTDEFFLVLDGQFDVALREAGGAERTVRLHAGEVLVVPRGTEHKPSSPGGSVLLFEPAQTMSTGDRHEGDIPSHVHRSAGTAL